MFFVFAALGLAEGGEGQGDLEVEQSGTNCQCSKSQEIIVIIWNLGVSHLGGVGLVEPNLTQVSTLVISHLGGIISQ